MNRIHSLVRGALVFIAGFLAVSAIPGGLALLAGFYAPPVEQLAGSVFRSFLVPGLTLLLVVGGSALAAAVLLVRRSRLACACAGLSGAFVMAFEFVEVLAIGSPRGPAFVMQVLYFAIGLALVCLSLLLASSETVLREEAPARP